MNKNQKRDLKIEIAGISVTILVGILGIIGQIIKPEEGLSLFIILWAGVILFYIISYPLSKFKQIVQQIEQNINDLSDIKQELNAMQDKLNFYKELSEIKAKLSIIENRKKGFIDPRWIIIIFILIILFLYLRSIGLI